MNPPVLPYGSSKPEAQRRSRWARWLGVGAPGPGGNTAFLVGSTTLTVMLIAILVPLYVLWMRNHAVVATAVRKPQPLPVLYALPEFSLTERSGATVTLATLKGKVWIADFIFTTCTGPCPLMTRQMADLQTALVGQPDVRLLTISVDPKRDTPERLTEYAKQLQADPQRWLFVTGERQAIYDLSAKGFKLGTIVEADEVTTTDHPILHSTKMALVDREGQIRGYYDGTSSEDVDRLKADAVRLAAEGR